jgi:hypothetical protein
MTDLTDEEGEVHGPLPPRVDHEVPPGGECPCGHYADLNAAGW